MNPSHPREELFASKNASQPPKEKKSANKGERKTFAFRADTRKISWTWDVCDVLFFLRATPLACSLFFSFAFFLSRTFATEGKIGIVWVEKIRWERDGLVPKITDLRPSWSSSAGNLTRRPQVNKEKENFENACWGQKIATKARQEIGRMKCVWNRRFTIWADVRRFETCFNMRHAWRMTHKAWKSVK